ncbi:tyrosine-type recombinase/integrase [Achromobacter sp. ES-001]|uniref:tyrosine-type recombinase/integrase n=1 Tax=Achromobacter sp. ES-001 TaxID=2860286 RepID=UPI001C641575|nr:tyrosine-type recombinase/integrase [Achromobacter sp. ES-001]QYJ21678.1 tyrosine-type recombinase/integrase [Achromobacter sp. ES-001]
MALTEAGTKALKPRDARYSVTDERGLVVEVFPTGGKLWHYRYRLNGKQHKVNLGRYPDMSLKLARTQRDFAAMQVSLGKSPAEEKKKSRAALSESTSVRDFSDRYMRDIVARDRKDITLPKRYVDKSILPAIGNKAVSEVTVDDVRAIIWEKKDHGRDAAAGAIRGVLKRLFDYAMTCGLVSANPVLALPLRHVHRSQSRNRALNPLEIRQFLTAAMQSNIRRQFKLALHLLLLTLVRKSELFHAEWKDVNFELAEWHIPIENSKTRKPHVIFLSIEAIECFGELQRLAGNSHLVLPGRGSIARPFADNAINTALKVALQGQDIPAFTIHDLRRTASTLLHEAEWPSDVIEKTLNHSIHGVRGVYNRAEYAQQRRRMLQRWSSFIEHLMGTDAISTSVLAPSQESK